MSIQVNDTEYLIGPAMASPGQVLNSLATEDTGARVTWRNQTCTILKNGRKYFLKYQPLNSQWSDVHPLKTKRELLEDWV